MGLFSGGSSTSTSDSYSGLRTSAPKGGNAFNSLLTQVPGDLKFQTGILQSRAGDANPLGLNSQGFLPGQMAGVNQFGKDMFNNVSSNYAGRGFLAPDNVAGVIGSAVTNAAPTLMNTIGTNAMNNQSVMSDRMNALQQAYNLYPSLLGSEEHQVQKQNGSNLFGQALAGAFQSALSPGTYIGSGGTSPAGAKAMFP